MYITLKNKDIYEYALNAKHSNSKNWDVTD